MSKVETVAESSPIRRLRAAFGTSSNGALGRGSKAYFFILPGLLVYIIFVLVPIISTVRYSFFEWTGFSPPMFIGFDNYAELVRDPDFWRAIGNNFFFVIFYTLIPIMIGLFLTSLMTRGKLRGMAFFVRYDQSQLWRISISGSGMPIGQPTMVADLTGFSDGITLDVCGNLYVVDQGGVDGPSGTSRIDRVFMTDGGDLIQVEGVIVESQDAMLFVTVQYLIRRTQDRQVRQFRKEV